MKINNFIERESISKEIENLDKVIDEIFKRNSFKQFEGLEDTLEQYKETLQEAIEDFDRGIIKPKHKRK